MKRWDGGFRVPMVLIGLGAQWMFCQIPQKRDAKPTSIGPKYEITGVVINSVTGDPVAGCHLTPSLNQRVGGNRQFPAPGNFRQPARLDSEFNCDPRGHFTVPLPSAGSWMLTASARGFVGQAYDAHPPYASAIVLTPEAPTKDLEFRISPEASIVGIVLDEAGEPVRNAQVMLQTPFRNRVPGDLRRLVGPEATLAPTIAGCMSCRILRQEIIV